jgi:sec-independent protein translocase protein TatA
MPHLGVPELLIILAIVLLLFGYSRLPQLGKGLGQSIRNFRQGLRSSAADEAADDERRPPSA